MIFNLKKRLHVLLEKNKFGQIKHLIHYIRHYRKFSLNNRKIEVNGTDFNMHISSVPHESTKLIQLLKELHVQNNAILLMPSEEQLNWWIINKDLENTLFSKAQSIFSPCEFEDAKTFSPTTNNTGVVPASKMCETFSDLKLDSNLLENYLVCMEYCKVIKDEGVLELVTGNNGTLNVKEKCFFFPGLIKKEKKKVSFEPSGTAYFSGWL